MAKLDNVKVIDSKIEVGGVEYVKVDRYPAAGDIVRIVECGGDPEDYAITYGSFYVVNDVDVAGDPQVTDDEGEEYDTCCDTLEIYARVAAEKRRLTVGDYAKVIAKGGLHNYEVGSVIKIVKDDHDSAPYKAEKPDGSIGNYIAENCIELATEAEFLAQRKPTVQYREVKRQARAGERIRIVNANCSFGHYDNGSELVVTWIDGDGDAHFNKTSGGDFFVRTSEYVVLEPVEDAPATGPKLPAVGDYVNVVGPNDNGHNYKIGSVVKLVTHEKRGDRHLYEAERADGTRGNYLRHYHLQPAAEAEFNAERKQAEIERKWSAIGRKVNEYKAGDIVRCIGLAGDEAGFGEVYDITAKRVHVNYLGSRFGKCAETYDIIKLVTPVEQRFDRPAAE